MFAFGGKADGRRLHAALGLRRALDSDRTGSSSFFSGAEGASGVWAMTAAPIAIVAALRETSVLFGAAIAVVVLKEPLGPVRVVAACLIVMGLVLIRVH